MIQSKATHIQPYIDLLESFTTGRISASQFEKSFLDLFKNDSSNFSETEYEALNGIFYDVEDFCSDPTIRDEGDLDERELKKRSEMHLNNLQHL